MERYDVVILGGGLIGSSVAMHLAARGVRSIAVVDVDLGGRYSSSELNAGGVRATWRSEMNVALSLASIEFFEQNAAEAAFDQKGYLWMYDEPGWREAQAALAWQNDRWKLGVRALSPADVQAYCPLIDGLDGVAGATFAPRDGLINPNLLKMLYRRLARERCGPSGLTWHNYTYVTGVEATEGAGGGVVVRASVFQEFSPAGDEAVKAILCDGTAPEEAAALELRADVVVNASGAWAKRTAPLYGHSVPVRPVRRQIAIAHARDVDLRPYGMFVDPSGVYFHREATHVLAGYADPDMPEEYRFRYGGQDWFEERIWPVLASRISKCTEMKHRSGWSGLYAYTPDHCGVIGRAPSQARIFECFGFTGRGAMQSWAAGRAAAELVTAGRFETIDCTQLRPERFAEGALLHETAVI